MGLFHRREQPQSDVQYSVGIGSERTTLVIGLGNPGKKYDGTRHNIGFEVLDKLADSEQGTWKLKKDLKCLVSELRIGQSRIVLVKPQTYMNVSGEAAGAVQRFYKLNNTQTIVVHDELDIPFGQIRMRIGGSAAGHNGIKSLISHIGEDFGRIRIGIKNDKSSLVDSADFVLQAFNKEERGQMSTLTTEAISCINEAIFADKLPTETRTFL
jgi:PTH1 family peptidyl-tRNA hydrolase